ncbi:cyclin-like protein, partial [Teratosphaeria nubilosa]
IGPHPSTIRVATRYMTQAKIEKRLFGHVEAAAAQERSLAEAREDTMRLQGVTWIDQVRRALHLPIRTYTTACVYYHNFRLAHPSADYPWADAAAASLLGSCKNEDTLKKSKDILAAAYNLKVPRAEQLGSDDVVFENASKQVLGVERLMLESSCFDFRSKHPHKLLVKMAKGLPESAEKEKTAGVAWIVLTDLMRTFAMLKQTPQTLALASLELAAHLHPAAAPHASSAVRDQVQGLELKKWSTTRDEVMETLLDALDLYTHHTAASILGTKYSLDDFLRIRLALNKECEEQNLPRFTVAPESDRAPLSDNAATLKVANGHPTPVSPPDPTQLPAPVQNPFPPLPEGGGTLRFMLNPQLAADEKEEVKKYFTEEWEEYEEE